MARAPQMTDELFESLLDAVAAGETMRAWSRVSEDRPQQHAVRAWIRRDPNRVKLLDQALELGATALVDDAIDAVDTDVENGSARATIRLKVAGIRSAKQREKQAIELSREAGSGSLLTLEGAVQELMRLYALALARRSGRPLPSSDPQLQELLS